MMVRATTIAYGAAFLVLGLLAVKLLREGAQLGQGAAKVLDAINPTNPDNVAARAVNGVVQTLTGERDATLGTKLWEWLNPGQAAADNAIAAPTSSRGAAGLAAHLRANNLDAELRAGAPADLWTEIASAWEGAVAESARQNSVRTGEGGAAFGIYPRP